jgi:hypothetical protein
MSNRVNGKDQRRSIIVPRRRRVPGAVRSPPAVRARTRGKLQPACLPVQPPGRAAPRASTVVSPDFVAFCKGFRGGIGARNPFRSNPGTSIRRPAWWRRRSGMNSARLWLRLRRAKLWRRRCPLLRSACGGLSQRLGTAKHTLWRGRGVPPATGAMPVSRGWLCFHADFPLSGSCPGRMPGERPGAPFLFRTAGGQLQPDFRKRPLHHREFGSQDPGHH